MMQRRAAIHLKRPRQWATYLLITLVVLAGIGIAAVLSLLVILRAGMALFWDIMLPGMLLGAIVGFATQRFGRAREVAVAKP